MKKLRQIRIIFSIIMLGIYIALFCSYAAHLSVIAELQIIPLLVKLFTGLSVLTLSLLSIHLFLSLLFGRIYCAVICPLGLLQDLFIRIGNKLKKRKNFKPQKKYKYLQWIVLISLFICLLTGMGSLVGLLDPYSHFGRLISQTLRPISHEAQNYISYLSYSLKLPNINPTNTAWPTQLAFITSSILLLSLFLLTQLKGRILCNTLCPVGTLLGFLSNYSLFQIQINKEQCNSCGSCERICKAGCINKTTKEIDFKRCINCFNCIDACKHSGIKWGINYQLKTKKKSELKFTVPNRREFIQTISLGTASAIGTGCKAIQAKRPITPPGSQSIEIFNQKCTSCQLCVSSCETNALQTSVLEYGIKGLFQPKMDFNKGYCDFECNTCSTICPTDAITPISLEQKKRTRIGNVRFYKGRCVVKREQQDCGACIEHCPTMAIKGRRYRRNLIIPEIEEELCIGCGICEYVCPVTPKAILVESLDIHEVAKEQKAKKLENTQAIEEFPF